MAIKRFTLAGIVLAALPAMLLSSSSCSSSALPPAPVTIGMTPNEVNSLVLIAQDQGYFAGNGLDVTVKTYSSGKAAVDGMMNREVDIATSSEYSFAGNVLDGKAVRLLATINKSSVEYLVSRKDKGINKLSDLKGKRLGVATKSRPEFALGRFLYLNGIASSDVTLVNVAVDRSADALLNGEVDAVATWQPYIDRVAERLGSGVMIWSVQNDQPSYNVLSVPARWAVEHPDLVKRLLTSLVQAESYNTSRAESAKAIVVKKLKYDDYFASVWKDHQFSVSLDKSLITAMEDEARWMISEGLSSEKTIPDFLDYIYADGLKAVKPGAVDIIR